MPKLKVLSSAVALCALSAASFAAATDWSATITGVTGEVNGAITAALPVAAIIIGATIGFKVIKRFVKG